MHQCFLQPQSFRTIKSHSAHLDHEFSSTVSGFEGEVNLGTEGTSENQNDKRQIKGFSFEDDRRTNGCGYNYEAESPDEGAFLVAAKEFGFQFCKRTQGSIFVREADPSSDEPVEREFKILNILNFTSKRKRMSAIVRDDKGDIFLFCKGDYGEAGLRTLVFSYKKLEEAEYKEWNTEFQSARNSQSSNKDEILEELCDKIERELILVGATAVEDKLQQGVAQCIDRLAQDGLKIWVLTGDKMETAINIGFSCSLLREEMQQIYISIKDMLENESEKNIKFDILNRIMNGSQMIKQEEDPHTAYALIIDGKALTFALDDDLKHQFLHLAITEASVGDESLNSKAENERPHNSQMKDVSEMLPTGQNDKHRCKCKNCD
ncbi:hypothetical protein POM88_024157 [Heracleum sosnowskyi]|uniref:Phospholipid-transporting ATPase n=1 Tax=Heracleum sosnowskyi TaxID=360622 RepID=A0AAD8I3V5_9APIA|nr:hypothetical protein POM88_024157 [Heracleum sosnowskyi]